VKPKNTKKQNQVKTTNEYDIQADKFLTDSGINLTIKPGPFKSPIWAEIGEDHGNHYVVRMDRAGNHPISFSFWGSIADKRAGEHPTAYDVLACISHDTYCPDTFDEFCAEYGYNKESRKARATWKHCVAFSQRLQAFFTHEEVEHLSTF
jgi:hypothetical protein